MQSHRRHFLSTWAITVALVVISCVVFSNGLEGQEKGKNAVAINAPELATPGNENVNKTETGEDVSSDYLWSNHDDYTATDEQTTSDDGTDNSSPGNNTLSAQAIPTNATLVNSSSTDTLPPPNSSSNSTDGNAQAQPPVAINVTISAPADNSTSTPAAPTTVEEKETGVTSTDAVTVTETSTKEEVGETTTDLSATSVSPSPNATATPTGTPSSSPSPTPISTQDAANPTNATTTPKYLEPPAEGGSRTWAVVVVSVLICFGIIFTLLYFIRGMLIRRRKADQRKLLHRASISSEGYFYGDGEGNHVGKFEL